MKNLKWIRLLALAALLVTSIGPATARAATPRLPANGSLRFIQSLQCRRAHGYTLRAQDNWVAVPHRSVYPACRPILEWRIIAGYLNQPVAAIDYTTRPPAPARTTVPLKKPQG